MKKTMIVAFSALALTACGQGADTTKDIIGDAIMAQAKRVDAIEGEWRGDDTARDAYRHPSETLGFFSVRPEHTVIEYAPGGGWYTRILAPLLLDEGRYIAVGFDPEAVRPLGEDFVERVRARGEVFSAESAKRMGLPEDKVPFYRSSAIPEELQGEIDRVLIFRTMHNLKRFGIADSEIEALFKALKPGGLLGVVQHRATPDAPADYVDGSKGYLKQDELIAFFEGKGFKLYKTSEINANPKDTADYEAGVWTLPPSYARGDEDRKKYAEIGESDRMTLLFKKPE